MKKNFFKKLSFVTAFALVASAVAPAGLASAATTPDIAKRNSTVYEGVGRSYSVKNASGYTVKWTVSGEGAEYASLSKTSGTKTVVSVDTEGEVAAKNASLTVRANFYKDGKLVVSKGDVVTVKVNATALDITTDADVKSVIVGETVDFNRKTTPANATSFTYWSVKDAKGEETNDATINASGNFTASKAGEYQVFAVAKNKKDGEVKATADAVTVTVTNKMISAKQYDLSSVKVTFAAPVVKADLEAGLKVNYKIGDVNIKEQKIKSITMDATNTVATVALYDAFVQEGVYAVTYSDMAEVTFTAATTKAEDVVAIEFKTDSGITVGEPKELQVNLTNKDGVIINNAQLEARVTYSTPAYVASLVADTLTFFNLNDTAEVTAVYHYYTYDSTGAENTLVTKRNFVAIDKATDVATDVLEWSIVDTATTPDFKKPVHFIAAEDAGKQLFVNLKLAAGTEYSSATDILGAQKVKLTSSDSSVLFVDEFGLLVPVKEGTVTVTAEYNDVFVKAFAVTVSPKRVKTSISVDPTVVTLSNYTGLGDSKTVEAKLLDQYGDVVADSDLTDVLVTAVAGNPSAYVPGAADITGDEVTFNADSITKGVYRFLITHPSSLTIQRLVTVNVVEPSSSTVVSYKLEMDADYDMKVAADADVASDVFGVALYGYAANGVKVSKIALDGTTYSVEVINNAKNLQYTSVSYAASEANVDLVTTSGSTIVKADTGLYIVNAKDATGKVLARGSFTVKDTQEVLELSSIKTFLTTASDATDAANDAFTFKLHGNTVVADTANASGTGVPTRVRINYVTYNETIGSYTLVHKLTIGYYVTVASDFLY
jgi:uncharacterized protein YcfL